MSKTAISALVACASLSLATISPEAKAKTAKCFLAINGTTYINGPCSFKFTDEGNGSFYFDDMKQQTRCKNRAEVPGECSVADTIITKDGIFGYLRITAPGKGLVYWNEGVALQAGGAFAVSRKGACWQSSTVKLCAW